MLVPVQEKTGLGSLDVVGECDKADVHLVVAIMDATRGVVSNENIHGWEVRELRLYLLLIEKEMASRLVFPRPGEATELDPTNLQGFDMQIPDRSREVGSRIMVAFDRQDILATTLLSYLQNHQVRQVAQ